MQLSFAFVVLCLSSLALVGVHAVRPGHAGDLEPVRAFVEADVVATASQSCTYNGVAGTCKQISACAAPNTRRAGLCPGSASVQCCLPPTAAAPATAAKKSSTVSSMTATGAQSCTFGGVMGTCKQISACVAPNKRYSGLCPGSSSVQCCIPPAGKSSAPAATSAAGRPKITMTTLQRLSETQHLLKWNRFKQVQGKTYASAQAEQSAYLVFRANRVRIIYLNDRHGGGYAIWRSTSPFTDVDATEFARHHKGAKMPALQRKATTSAKPRFAQMEVSGAAEHGYVRVGEVLPQPAPADVPLDISLPPPAVELATPVADVVLPAASTVAQETEEKAAWEAFQQQAAAQQEDALAMHVLAAAHAPAAADAATDAAAAPSSTPASSFMEVTGGKKCSFYGNAGICRKHYTCRTKKEYVASECGGDSRCCLGDADDLPDDDPSNKWTDGPVAPSNFGTGIITPVGGTLSVDYRSYYPKIKDQQQCGSCWAHAATSLMEAAGARANLAVSPLAPQWLVDCNRDGGNLQCSGGMVSNALKFGHDNRPVLESEYPYVAAPGATCQKQTGSSSFIVDQSGYAARCPCYIDGTTGKTMGLECDNPNEVDLLAQLKTRGPLAITVDASSWQAYDGGIMPASACSHAWTAGDHAVVIAGYGEENGQAFWLVLNSWSEKWGESGYVRLAANAGSCCGCANLAMWATATAAPAA